MRPQIRLTFTDSWLVIPRTEERFHSDPLLNPIHDLFHDLFAKGIRVSPMGVAPDREYFVSGQSHVFYYCRLANTSPIVQDYGFSSDRMPDFR
ncbi:MAG: hypothetical protein ACFB2W_23620 [Leptolyngbyaceae cyanobacterium]